MAERNHASNGRPALCTHEELIHVVWGDEPGHGPQDLAYVIHQLRRRVGQQPLGPALIENVRGHGYRLVTRAPVELAHEQLNDRAPHARGSRVLSWGSTAVGLVVGGILALGERLGAGSRRAIDGRAG
jgi:hypothetical protein